MIYTLYMIKMKVLLDLAGNKVVYTFYTVADVYLLHTKIAN